MKTWMAPLGCVVIAASIGCGSKSSGDASSASAVAAGSAPPVASSAAPPPPPPPVHKARTLAAGGLHTCALTADKSVKCWGENSYGQVGKGTSGPHVLKESKPVAVAGLSDVRDISSGGAHTCVIHGSPAQVSCWGKNKEGQVTNKPYGADDAQPSPAHPERLTVEPAFVSVGNVHTCVGTKDGKVHCWGMSLFGELGVSPLGRSTDVPSAVGIDGVADVALGGGAFMGHTCALRTAGNVRCWGGNFDGQLGTGKLDDHDADKKTQPSASASANWEDRYVPQAQPVVGVSDAMSLVSNMDGVCAVTRDGKVFCWGEVAPIVGEDPKATEKTKHKVPTPRMAEGLPKVSALALGSRFACAIVEGEKVLCWGNNAYGALGHKPDPKVDIAGAKPSEITAAAGATEIVAGAYHVCVRKAGGEILCWGGNESGQLGTGDTKDSPEPKTIAL